MFILRALLPFLQTLLFVSIVAADQFTVPEDENPFAVPTFECLGLYYKVETDSPGECTVEYRKTGTNSWNKALPLWFDKRDSEFRGSIVGLQPATKYEVRLITGGKEKVISTQTRNEDIPVGEVTYLDGGITAEELHVTEPGKPDAWHLITPKDNMVTTIDPENFKDYNIVVESSFVIIRGLELKNAAIHGILIKSGVHDVVIEDCRITFWGRCGGPRSFGNTGGSDSAIFAEQGTAGLIIQHNLIEHPRGASNDWDTGHPNGPQAVTLINSLGGNIIRYNEIRSTEDHGFNDAIGGGSNYSFEGSPCRDSDIYGNIISNVWDDGIESEGANMNVRIWNNYIHHTFQHIATAATSKGPLYIFRNIFGVSRRTHENPLGGSMIKIGERDPYIGGIRYIFHNTALQPCGAFSVFSGHPCTNNVTRNNIFDCPGTLTGRREPAVPSDLDYDLFTGIHLVTGYEEHGFGARPAFVESQKLEFYLAPTTTKIEWGVTTTVHDGKELRVTDKVMTIPNPAIDAGIPIPNFNAGYKGNGPDLGAFERGAPPLKYGRHALEYNISAPWER
ncbi:MAG: right-handed parallel beta-helix repeat-containing protein [Candidatus Latescibacteria bacterium]|nr:right-handed parallel beta-helix repeat-containing protein [Candidatus Latescibacterota bacterium]